jgi:hypothetical protein
MPVVDTIQTVRREVSGKEQVDRDPQFKVGDYVEKIWSGMNCTVRAVRFNHDNNQYEYLDGGIMSDGWMLEKSIQHA